MLETEDDLVTNLSSLHSHLENKYLLLKNDQCKLYKTKNVRPSFNEESCNRIYYL